MATKGKDEQWTRAKIAALSEAEFDKHRDSILRWMDNGGSSKGGGTKKAQGGKRKRSGKGKRPLSRKQIEQMSDAEFDRRHDEIVEWARAGGDSSRPTGDYRS